MKGYGFSLFQSVSKCFLGKHGFIYIKRELKGLVRVLETRKSFYKSLSSGAQKYTKMWWYHLFAWCVNTKKCTHFGIVAVEGELPILMMLSITFQKCLWNLFQNCYKAWLWASQETRLITQTETWFVTPDSSSQLDHPTNSADVALNGLELFLNLTSPPSEDTYCQSYLSKTHLGSCASVALGCIEN